MSRHRWFVVAVFFAFMLLHQSDRLLIGPLTTPIMETFGINEAQMGAVSTGALLVGAVCYPLWGYLFDRYERAKFLSLASLIWGSTTWLSAIVPSYPAFLVTRASTGIDDASYPGLYSLISDYFAPQMRGRIYGLLQITMPVGYMLGIVLALVLGQAIGWRGVFYLTGSLGVLLAISIFVGVREVPRGRSEPELQHLQEVGSYGFSWQVARGLLQKRSLQLLFAQGFFGVFPLNVVTYWFFRYLETERGYSSNEVLFTMIVAVIAMGAGYFVGGIVGDAAYRRTPRGRLLVCTASVLLSAVLMLFTLNIPPQRQGLFLVVLGLNALLLPFFVPNTTSAIYDITLPEVRSTAAAVQSFVASTGAATAPWLAGLIAVQSSLREAILWISVSGSVLCAAFLALATYLVPRDIEALRAQMRQRAAVEQARQQDA